MNTTDAARESATADTSNDSSSTAPDENAPDVLEVDTVFVEDTAPDVSEDRAPDAVIDVQPDRVVLSDATIDTPEASVLVDASADRMDISTPDAPIDAGMDAREAGVDARADAPIDVRPDVVVVDGPTFDVISVDTAPPSTTCNAPQTMCGSACVNTQLHSQHCGACGRACATGTVCSSGMCSAVTQLVAGEQFNCALLADSTVRCWGSNERGQLGNGAMGTNEPVPVPVLTASGTLFSGAAQLFAGRKHVCARMRDNTAQCWGNNESGQLGDGSMEQQRLYPAPVPGLTNVTSMALGSLVSFALRNDGTVQAWGTNLFGLIGVGNPLTSVYRSPVSLASLTGVRSLVVGFSSACAALSDGTVRCWGSNSQGQSGQSSTSTTYNTPTPVAGVTNVIELFEGNTTVCARRMDGSFLCWGSDSYGQMATGTAQTARPTPVSFGGTGVVSMAIGSGHLCVRTATEVRCVGRADQGQLGDGTVPAGIGGRLTLDPVRGLNGTVVELAAGETHTCARLSNGVVQCWGSDQQGQLGDEGTYGRLTPTLVPGSASMVQISAGGRHTCARMMDNTARCWGGNATGELGDGTTIGGRFSAVTVQGLNNVAQLSSSSFDTCAVLNDGTVRCWGYNVDGENGDGTTTQHSTPVTAIGLSNVLRVDGGQTFFCALLMDRTVKCWGHNNTGETGQGFMSMFPSYPAGRAVMGLTDAVDMSAGLFHICAAQASGGVSCWATNDSGQLGDGTRTIRTRATPTMMISTATAVSAGYSHSCALLQDRTVQCWGENRNGQVGNATYGGQLLTPVPVFGLTNVASISAGDFHTCARRMDGTVWCWGQNYAGQVGVATQTVPQAVPVQVPGLSGVLEISAGEAHTCARSADGVRCWGADNVGQLGVGHMHQVQL